MKTILMNKISLRSVALSALCLVSFFQLNSVQAKSDNSGAGIVLFTAIQRSKVQQPTSLSFGCSVQRGKHEIYSFDFYKHSPQKPFGTVKKDEQGLRCDPVNWGTFADRHASACMDMQTQWAWQTIQDTFATEDMDQHRIRVSVISQIGQTHWQDDWGTYILGLFSFVSESKADELECDFKIQLQLQKNLGDNQYETLEQLSYSPSAS